MKLKSTILVILLTLGMTIGNTKAIANDLDLGGMSNVELSTLFAKSSSVISASKSALPWYFVTYVTTTTHFIAGYPVWVSVTTTTRLEYRPAQ